MPEGIFHSISAIAFLLLSPFLSGVSMAMVAPEFGFSTFVNLLEFFISCNILYVIANQSLCWFDALGYYYFRGNLRRRNFVCVILLFYIVTIGFMAWSARSIMDVVFYSPSFVVNFNDQYVDSNGAILFSQKAMIDDRIVVRLGSNYRSDLIK